MSHNCLHKLQALCRILTRVPARVVCLTLIASRFKTSLLISLFESSQALATAGAFSMTIFEHQGALEYGTYMAVANLRDSLGLATTSRIYKWVDRQGNAWQDCASDVGM